MAELNSEPFHCTRCPVIVTRKYVQSLGYRVDKTLHWDKLADGSNDRRPPRPGPKWPMVIWGRPK